MNCQQSEYRPNIDRLKQHVSANQGRSRRVKHIACRYDQAAIDAVRNHAGNKEKHKCRKKLKQPDEPEIKNTARNPVNMPANGNRQHLDAENIARAADNEEDEIKV